MAQFTFSYNHELYMVLRIVTEFYKTTFLYIIQFKIIILNIIILKYKTFCRIGIRHKKNVFPFSLLTSYLFCLWKNTIKSKRKIFFVWTSRVNVESKRSFRVNLLWNSCYKFSNGTNKIFGITQQHPTDF